MKSEPPAGSTIEHTAGSETVTYCWRPSARHPLQWIPMFFGSFMLFGAVVMPVMILGVLAADEQMPVSDALIFGAILLCGGSFLLYSGLRIRGRESITLSDNTFEYDTGPSVLPMPLMLWFGPMFLFGPQMMGGTTMTATHLFRKKHTQSSDRISQFVLERVGERQRLRVDFGADRIEIGNLLREPEREWLAEQLREWLAAHNGS